VTHLLMPDFADFARLHPEVETEILSSDEPVNLTNREADVAIRVVYDRNALPLNLHGLKGPECFGGVYDRAVCWHERCREGSATRCSSRVLANPVGKPGFPRSDCR
jgi:DNA-binding transcriptional LysR family regulator